MNEELSRLTDADELRELVNTNYMDGSARRAAVAIWLLVGSHSLIVLYTLDRKGIIKL